MLCIDTVNKDLLMIPAQFNKLIAELENLTDSQVWYVEKLQKGTDSASQLISELEERMVESPECPHCHSSLINRHGKVSNMQRYGCKNSGKTFVATTALHQELAGKLEKDSVLCSDGYKPYIALSVKNDLIHKRLDVAGGIKVIGKVFHIQNVNAYHSRLKAWIGGFHGVAIKYLDHYLDWFRYMDSPENLNENKLFRIQQQLMGT